VSCASEHSSAVGMLGLLRSEQAGICRVSPYSLAVRAAQTFNAEAGCHKGILSSLGDQPWKVAVSHLSTKAR